MKIKNIHSVKKLQQDLANGLKWIKPNNMEADEHKFEVMSYSLNRSRYLRELPFSNEFRTYHISEYTTILPVKTVKDLGVIMSSDRSWAPHIDHNIESAKIMASWVMGVFRDRSPEVMITLYKSKVRSEMAERANENFKNG